MLIFPATSNPQLRPKITDHQPSKLTSSSDTKWRTTRFPASVHARFRTVWYYSPAIFYCVHLRQLQRATPTTWVTMYRNILLQSLTLLYLTFTTSGFPLLPHLPKESSQLLRPRASYSVVAVDGGSAATNTAQLSSTRTLTLTTSETKTVAQTKSLTTSLTAHGNTTPITTSTVTAKESGPTITVTHTVSEKISAMGAVSVSISTLVVTETTTAIGGACSPPLAVPNVPETTTIVQTSTVTSFVYGTPPKPTTYSNGGGVRYTASQPWNNTSTIEYGPTATGWATGQASSSLASHML